MKVNAVVVVACACGQKCTRHGAGDGQRATAASGSMRCAGVQSVATVIRGSGQYLHAITSAIYAGNECGRRTLWEKQVERDTGAENSV